MKMYEILICGFLLPAFWFFWLWAFRVLAAIVGAKLVGGVVERVKGGLTGGATNGGGADV